MPEDKDREELVNELIDLIDTIMLSWTVTVEQLQDAQKRYAKLRDKILEDA